MKISVEESLIYAHAQVLEIIENHVDADIEDISSLKEVLLMMAGDLQNVAGGLH